MWVTPRAPASPHKCSSSLMDRRTSFRFGCTPSYTQQLQWFHSDHATKIIIELSLFLTGPSTLLVTLSPKLILSLCLHMTWHQVSAKMWPSSPNFYSNWYLKNSVMGYHKKLNLFCGGKKPKGNMSIIKTFAGFHWTYPQKVSHLPSKVSHEPQLKDFSLSGNPNLQEVSYVLG